MSDSEDDTPLIYRVAVLQQRQQQPLPTDAPELCQEVESSPLDKVEGEDQTLKGKEWVDRAYRFRDRANKIFKMEKKAVLDNPQVSQAQKQSLLRFDFRFDRGTTRRGICKYPRSRDETGYICLSAKMVDRGTPAEKIQKIIRHEISHACTPGCHHNQTWKDFDILIGGDGQRCCEDEEVEKIIGHRVEVYCSRGGPVEGGKHYFAKMQKAPSRRFMRDKCCGGCRLVDGVTSRLVYRRV